MPDAGYNKTEKLLGTMEWRLDRIYGQALKESKEKLNNYLEKYEKEKREMLMRA